MASEDSHPTHLPPSELGTKDYWETYYARTLSHISSKQKPSPALTQTHRQPVRDRDNDDSDSDSDSNSDSDDEVDDDDDPGTSWFSEHNAPDKVLRFLTSEEFPLAPCNTTTTGTATATNDQPSILDLGTGNGSMLALLRKRGKFGGVMVGVDYSGQSVELARELQRLRIHSAYLSDSEDEDDEGGDEEGQGKSGDSDTNIRFEEWDILGSGHVLSESGSGSGSGSASEGPRLDWFPYEQGGFDIVLDKGTFDAVSLSDEVEEEAAATSDEGKKGSKVIQRRVCERYPDIARRLVRKGGFLVVTSCNWTEEELIRWFTGEGEKEKDGEDRLSVWGRVEYPRFRFGGMEGQGVCTVCFERR